MADPKNTKGNINLPPTPTVTYINPRRTSPENSITLRHHRLARDPSKRHSPAAISGLHASPTKAWAKAPRRNSSEESNETGPSDPRRWFDKSNKNASGTLDSNAMDIDPPFFQKETDSSNEEAHHIPSLQSSAYRHGPSLGASFRPSLAKSSSADDYRSVIDDLTVENKRLKEELRRFKQMGPDSLRNDKLFEVKVHGLPSKKKRELEATLRDFTTKLERSSTGASTSRKKAPGKSKEGASSASKHASSTSGSNSRPVDSAYASMGTGPGSSSHAPPERTRASRVRSNQNIEEYLRDIPEGLWPRPARMTEYEKKKLVVRRLEHLFTGRMGHPAERSLSTDRPQPIVADTEMEDPVAKATPTKEGIREAMIRKGGKPHKEGHSHTGTSLSHTNTQSQSYSNSHSYADQSNSHGNSHDNDKDSGSGSGSGRRSAKDGKNTSPQEDRQASEQRPTRPRDLDPDRKQVPADNMEYIRHLGIVAPESQPRFSAKDVSPDAEGWVYLNLLGNLAQLHILNVTPDFIRSAVSEKSTKFQLSHDGRKIRWRGGDEGTRFTSDSSGSKSQSDRSTDETEGSSNRGQSKKRKRPKGSRFNLGVQDSNSSEIFHYKPLFVHDQNSWQTSVRDESTSSDGQSEGSNQGQRSKWDQSGVSTGRFQRKRRRDGAIIYYSGAPFCTDLSGDSGDVSPDIYDMTSSGAQAMRDSPVELHLVHRPLINRSASGSSIPFKPLSEPNLYTTIVDLDGSDGDDILVSDTDDRIAGDFPWSDTHQDAVLANLEASGLGAVYPDDHFVIVVSTRRPKNVPFNSDERSDSNVSPAPQPRAGGRLSQDMMGARGIVDTMAGRLARISTKSPGPRHTPVGIEYVTGKIHRLPPVPLPPPAFFFPSGESGTDDSDDSLEEDISASSERSILSKRAMLECSPDSDNRALSGNDEEDEYSDGLPPFDPSASLSSRKRRRMSGVKRGDDSSVPPLSKETTGSSVATAGGAGSGYYSSMEDA